MAEIGASSATSSPRVVIEENGEAPDSITVTIPSPGVGYFTRLRVNGKAICVLMRGSSLWPH